jgi:hypothetical protein
MQVIAGQTVKETTGNNLRAAASARKDTKRKLYPVL